MVDFGKLRVYRSGRGRTARGDFLVARRKELPVVVLLLSLLWTWAAALFGERLCLLFGGGTVEFNRTHKALLPC